MRHGEVRRRARISGARPAVRRDRYWRLIAATAGLAVAGGATAMLVALVAAPGPWTHGYVSEAGIPGLPLAPVYRGGLLLLSVGVMLLGAPVARVARLAAALLGVAGLLAGLAAAVPCSTGCPLPPYQQSSGADLVHAAVSIAGLAAIAFAMVALASSPTTPAVLRRLAVRAAAVTLPLAAVIAAAMLLLGRGVLTAAVERVLLVVPICWLIGTAAIAATRRHVQAGPDGTPGVPAGADVCG